MFLPLKSQNSIENINIEVVRCLAELMHKVGEIDITILLQSNSFHEVLMLFYETVVNVNEKEANNELVWFFSLLISHR